LNFKDKIVWITGASSGIGEALAKAFAAEGAKLILSARRKEELERVQKSCGLTDDNALILPLDLSNSNGFETLAENVFKKFGRIDVLVNNGGVSQRSLAKDTPLEIDRRIMEVNYFGQIALTKAVLPYMLKQRDGHVVVISSIAGKFGFWYRSAYSATKHALQGFFESFRMETESEGIRTLLVFPGKIRTNISLNAVTESGGKHNRMDKSTAAGMSPEECADLILDAMRRNKEEILIGGKEIKAVWIKRHLPKWFGKIIRRQPKE
jgi:dehydrogenase/reductase SDR family member 7B